MSEKPGRPNPTAAVVAPVDLIAIPSGLISWPKAVKASSVAVSYTHLDVYKRQVPAARLLVETDSPYRAPAPHSGQTNHPAWVRHVAEFVARLRDESPEQVAAITSANYSRLFGVSLDAA